MINLGKTDLHVSRIGIGCGNGITADDLDYAIGMGINYVFTSTDFHSFSYSRSYETIAKYCQFRSSKRDKMVLAACSYVNDPEKIIGVVMDQLHSLRAEYLDVFHWGWVTQAQYPSALLQYTSRALRSDEIRVRVDQMLRIRREVQDELRVRGYARYLGVSTHDRRLAASLVADENLDVLMIRYNIGHRGFERDVRPALSEVPQRPGIVAFNVTHSGGVSLAGRPAWLPAENYAPTHADLYRHALATEDIDVVLSGPSRREEVDALLTLLNAEPQDPGIRAYLDELGDLHRQAAGL